MPGLNPDKTNNFFLKMRPLHRMFLGIAFSLAVYFIIPARALRLILSTQSFGALTPSLQNPLLF